MHDFIIAPNPDDQNLSKAVEAIDENGHTVTKYIIQEKPLTIFINKQEIVTLMTVGDHPKLLAVGYLVNQNILAKNDRITAIDADEDINVVVVRTQKKTQYEEKTRKKITTSGCAQGTIFADIMEKFDSVKLPTKHKIKTSQLFQILKKINTTPSLYLKAGAIHGCVLCQKNKALIYMEDVGRHNAVDKIAGYMFLNQIAAHNKIFYTTGRLTSEMIIKCVLMQIPILVSRSGFTAAGVELAKNANLTLIGRAKGKRFAILAGKERVLFDA